MTNRVVRPGTCFISKAGRTSHGNTPQFSQALGPLGFVLTGGEASDYNAVPDLLAIPVGKPRLFLADKGYDGDFVREELLIHGFRPVIPPKANRKNPPACDFQTYKDRNRIERMFNRLKQFRRVATRYDKTRKSFSAFLALAAAKIWPPYFVNRT